MLFIWGLHKHNFEAFVCNFSFLFRGISLLWNQKFFYILNLKFILLLCNKYEFNWIGLQMKVKTFFGYSIVNVKLWYCTWFFCYVYYSLFSITGYSCMNGVYVSNRYSVCLDDFRVLCEGRGFNTNFTPRLYIQIYTNCLKCFRIYQIIKLISFNESLV
jgi:hypothetical protein